MKWLYTKGLPTWSAVTDASLISTKFMDAAWTHNSSEPLDSRSLSASSLSADVEGLFTSLDVEGSHVFAASKNVPDRLALISCQRNSIYIL